MELLAKRTDFTAKSTISDFFIDDVRQGFILEDTVRKGPKVHGKTAIPVGRYAVIVNMSNRFKVMMPLLVDVPGFEGIRIHPGNVAENTEGCLLVGLLKGPQPDFIGRSRDCYNHVFEQIKTAFDAGERVWITIEGEKA